MSTPRTFFVSQHEEEETLKIATAILRKCHHVLTGMEIRLLEHIIDDLSDSYPGLLLSWDEINWFYSLQTQFAYEIGQYYNHR